MSRLRRFTAIAIVGTAALAALVPRPAPVLERVYSRTLYPTIQAALTSASNAVPVAVMDVALIAVVVTLLWWARSAWRARQDGGPSAAGRFAWRVSVLAAAAYLWFLGAWGLNYARPPIEVRLSLPSGASTADEVAALLTLAIEQANQLYGDTRADYFVPYDAERDLTKALRAVDVRHGRRRPTVPGVPKPTLLAAYFRMAGVDGLTAPVALETLLNPDLTAAERPFTLAHEWAHLAGHAPEADANFVAWLVTQEAGTWPHTRYSGWLFLVSETAWQVPAEERRRSLAALGSGPRQDLADIARRAEQRVDLVQRVGWRVYDSYLKSQGVGDGVRSYSRVVDLIVRARRTAPAPPAMPQ